MFFFLNIFKQINFIKLKAVCNTVFACDLHFDVKWYHLFSFHINLCQKSSIDASKNIINDVI